jgi:hypothetical protein
MHQNQKNQMTVNTMEGDMKMPAQSPPSPAQPETDSTGNSIDANVASNTAGSLSDATTVSHRGIMETTGQASSFGELDPAAIAAIFSTLLAENPALGQMHERLVLQTKKNSEDEFWASLEPLLEDYCEHNPGIAKVGTSSLKRPPSSHSSGDGAAGDNSIQANERRKNEQRSESLLTDSQAVGPAANVKGQDELKQDVADQKDSSGDVSQPGIADATTQTAATGRSKKPHASGDEATGQKSDQASKRRRNDQTAQRTESLADFQAFESDWVETTDQDELKAVADQKKRAINLWNDVRGDVGVDAKVADVIAEKLDKGLVPPVFHAYCALYQKMCAVEDAEENARVSMEEMELLRPEIIDVRDEVNLESHSFAQIASIPASEQGSDTTHQRLRREESWESSFQRYCKNNRRYNG